MSLYHNLNKDRSWCGIVVKVLTKSGAAVRSRAMMYKAVVNTVLLYGSDSWAVMGSMLTALEGFHHQVERKSVGKTAWSAGDGGR